MSKSDERWGKRQVKRTWAKKKKIAKSTLHLHLYGYTYAARVYKISFNKKKKIEMFKGHCAAAGTLDSRGIA